MFKNNNKSAFDKHKRPLNVVWFSGAQPDYR